MLPPGAKKARESPHPGGGSPPTVTASADLCHDSGRRHRARSRPWLGRAGGAVFAASTGPGPDFPPGKDTHTPLADMPGNTFGKLFTVTSFGESHGFAIGAVVDGCPPGLALGEGDIQPELERRRSGKSRHTSQRREPDAVRILSGVFEGRTTGTPIALVIENTDQRPRDYEKIKDVFRPAHADYTYLQKYGIRDYRGGGRASARETAMRVAAGAIAKKYLRERLGVEVRGYLAQLGPHAARNFDWAEVERNAFFCPDAELVSELERFMDALRKAGDSAGARVTVVASGVPPGLGEPAFDRLDAALAHALMSINAVRGVEIGAGFAAVTQKGTEHRDEITAGGVPEQQRRRHPRRHLHRAGHRGQHRVEAHLEPAPSGTQRERAGRGDRGRDPRPARPLRGHSGHPDRGSDDGPRPDGPLAAPPRPECRRQHEHPDHPGAGAIVARPGSGLRRGRARWPIPIPCSTGARAGLPGSR